MFFVGSLMLAGYNYLLDSNAQYTKADVNSAVDYFEYTRQPLSHWHSTHPGVDSEVSFKELIFPKDFSLVQRNDTHFFVDRHGLYITFSKPPRELADALSLKYSSATGNSALRWDLSYYHVGYKNTNGCLSTVFDYVEEKSLVEDCSRKLPDRINVGDLVVTDRDLDV